MHFWNTMLRSIGRLRAKAPAEGGGFTPADLPGLARWYDASDEATVTVTGGGTVSQWDDKSPSAVNATQMDAGLRYEYSLAAVSGKNAMTSSYGSGQMELDAELSLTTTGWVVVIGGNSGASIMVVGSSNANNYTGGFNSFGDGTVYSQDAVDYIASTAAGCDDGSIHCFVFRNVATAVEQFWDGVQIGGTATFSNASLFGGISSYGSGFSLNGTICEIFAGVGELTNDHIAQITAYSQQKWGTP